MNIIIVCDDAALLAEVQQTMTCYNYITVYESFEQIQGSVGDDLLMLVNPPRIPQTPLADNQILLDFDISELRVWKKCPLPLQTPAVFYIDGSKLVIKVCDGFDTPHAVCKMVFYNIEFAEDVTATAVCTAEIQSCVLEAYFRELEVNVSEQWNYIALPPNVMDELVHYSGRELLFCGSYLQSTLLEQNYEFEYTSRQTVYALLNRIVQYFGCIDSHTIKYKLCDVGPAKERVPVLDFVKDTAEICKREMLGHIQVRYGLNVVNIVPYETPRFSEYLFLRDECDFESCVIRTHPFHAVHCYFWVLEIKDALEDYLNGKSGSSGLGIGSFARETFWKQFYEEYFYKQIAEASRLNIWINEKRAPVIISESEFLAAFTGISPSCDTLRSLYHFRCKAFCIPEAPFEQYFPPEFEQLEQDFASYVFRGHSLRYTLFAVQYYNVPRPRSTEWTLRSVNCRTVYQLMDRVAQDGIEVSALFTAKGRILYPGDLEATLEPGTEIVVDADDEEEIPNYFIL